MVAPSSTPAVARAPRSAPRRAMLRFVAWRRAHVPPAVALMVLAVIVGIGAGVGAWMLKFCISHLTHWLLAAFKPQGFNWYILSLPFAGIFLAVCYQRFWVRQSLEHGTHMLSQDIAAGRYKLRPGLCYEPIVASVATLSFGGSAGAEGPIATAGAAFGSNIGRIAGVQPAVLRILIGCGAGAGIAGIFKAPIGGALFTLEVLRMRLTTLSVMALIVSSVCGAMTCYALTGFTFDVQFLPRAFFDPASLGWVCALGVFCGFYSIYYNKVTALLHRFFGSFRNHWLRNLSGAAILAVCLFLFPALYGEGYGVMTHLVNGHFEAFLSGSVFAGVTGKWAMAGCAALLLLLKVWATISSNSAGGVAGDFAPTIFAGAVAGLVFASVVNLTFHADLPVGLFVLLGTAGAFAGIIHAPLMAMFLVAEMMGNGFGYFLPLMVVAAISYIVVKLFTPRSRYAAADHDDLDALMNVKISPQNNSNLPLHDDPSKIAKKK